jgi:5-methylcytosine-specific restriction endonuclease McrA
MNDRLAYRAETLEMVLQALDREDTLKAAELVRSRYRFDPPMEQRSSISELDRVRVFLQDGFIDRYSGDKLFFPPVLELISLEIPKDFPSHPNGKFTECHVAHWELYSAVDHVVPLARGGPHQMSNWATTSTMHNQIKSHWTLEDLGWHLLPPGELKDWDGGLGWFLEYMKGRGAGLLNVDSRLGEWPSNSWFRRWHKAALRATEELPRDVHRSWKGTIRP